MRVLEAFPIDDALPGLAAVLDGEAFSASLESRTGAACSEAKPRWLRWTPGVRAIVLGEVTVAGRPAWVTATVEAGVDPAMIAASPEAKRIASAVRDRCVSAIPIHALGDALVEWYPASIKLPGLASPAVAASGADLVAYRPSQRAVLRSEGRYWKAYASEARFERAVEGLAQAARIDGLRTPALVASFPQDRLTVQRSIPGEPLPDSPAARVVLGEALRRLHTSSVRPPRHVTAAGHLDAARKTGRKVAAAASVFAPRMDALLERLASAQPPDPGGVPSHGDFHDAQALLVDGGVALLDFDSLTLAASAFDFARFAAHAVGDAAGVKQARERIAGLAEGYGDVPDAMEWYLAVAILRRAGHPLRRLDPGWMEKTLRLLEAAQEAAEA